MPFWGKRSSRAWKKFEFTTTKKPSNKEREIQLCFFVPLLFKPSFEFF
jgi:hypothetical protein